MSPTPQTAHTNTQVLWQTTEECLMHQGHVPNLLTAFHNQMMAIGTERPSEHQALLLLVTISRQQLAHSHTNMARTHSLFLG